MGRPASFSQRPRLFHPARRGRRGPRAGRQAGRGRHAEPGQTLAAHDEVRDRQADGPAVTDIEHQRAYGPRARACRQQRGTLRRGGQAGRRVVLQPRHAQVCVSAGQCRRAARHPLGQARPEPARAPGRGGGAGSQRHPDLRLVGQGHRRAVAGGPGPVGKLLGGRNPRYQRPDRRGAGHRQCPRGPEAASCADTKTTVRSRHADRDNSDRRPAGQGFEGHLRSQAHPARCRECHRHPPGLARRTRRLQGVRRRKER